MLPVRRLRTRHLTCRLQPFPLSKYAAVVRPRMEYRRSLRPKFVGASAATFLKPTDSVIGVTLNDDSRAYPLAILDLHEVVNDTVGDTPIAVTYCPLCDSSVVFDRRIAGQQRELGVSGRLYNSNVLMYDRQASDTESLVSQMMARGVSGPLANVSLARLPLEVTTWQSWLERHPSSKVLSPDTGFGRKYDRSVYSHYFESPQLMFAIEPMDQRVAPKTRVLGVAAGGHHRAYPVERFLENAEGPVPQTLGESRFCRRARSAVAVAPGRRSARRCRMGLQLLVRLVCHESGNGIVAGGVSRPVREDRGFLPLKNSCPTIFAEKPAQVVTVVRTGV